MSARLTLRHRGKVFLDRYGFECRWFGVFVHKIADADPGLDLHDHPWPFVTVILRGGYTEQVSPTRLAPRLAKSAEDLSVRHSITFSRGNIVRTWHRWSVHTMPLTDAHRIMAAEPGTWTLLVHGRKRPTWGFYMPDGWIDHTRYPYDVRRPVTVDER